MSKKRSQEPKRYYGRLMESEWLIAEHFLDDPPVAHAFRYYGPAGGHAAESECKQATRDGAAAMVAGSKASRCNRCAAIMALPGMNERRRDDGATERGT